MSARLRRSTLWCILALMTAKGAWLLQLEASSATTFVLCVVVFFCNGFGLGEAGRVRGWRSLFVLSLTLALVQVVLFVPDGFATVRSTGAGLGLASLAVAVGTVVWVGVLVALRLPLFWLLSHFSRGGWLRRTAQGAIAALGFHAADACLFLAFPLFSWAALGVPVPFAPRVSPPGPAGVGPVLVDPILTHEERARIWEQGENGLILFARYLARGVAASAGSGELLVLLPETALFVERRSWETLLREFELEWRAIAAERRWELIAGVQWDDSNRVVWGHWDRLHSRPAWRAVKAKGDLGRVPFFERRVWGFALREGEDSASIPEGGPFDASPLVRNSLPFPLPDSLAICYEALVPSGWEFGQPRVVLTNHSLFSRFRLLSWVYDANLRLLGTVYSSPLILVGNQGQTGFFSWRGSSLAPRVVRLEGFSASL